MGWLVSLSRDLVVGPVDPPPPPSPPALLLVGLVKMKPPDHSGIRKVANRYLDLIQVIALLDPEQMDKLHGVYSQALSMLLRCVWMCACVCGGV